MDNYAQADAMTAIKNNTIKETKTSARKPFRKLGFTTMETAEIVIVLKKLMANYQVYYHKMRNFHWNVEGSEFFELHDEFEKEYNEAKKNIDLIAERIRVFGIMPSMTMKEVIKISEIRERTDNLPAFEMIKETLKDYEILHELMLDAINAALETGDIGTENLIADFILDIEKRHWMFSSWVK
jgi:starvation-inducible DNA-binding protein